jgi:hypothetical protein
MAFLGRTIPVLEQDLPHPMQSCIEGLTPFPYADLLSLINESKDKNKYFSTCMHLASYIACVYVGYATAARVHRGLCQKIKNKCWVSMSRQKISNPWPSIYWKHFNSTLQLHFEGYKEGNSELSKRRENSTLRAKLLWRNYYFIIKSASLCPLIRNTVSSPQALPLLMENLFVFLI